jgi:predicted dehydrogenase
LKVAIIGAVLQAKRRAPAVKRAGDEIVAVCAAHDKSAKGLADQLGCQHSIDWRHVVMRDDVDSVIICTPPSTHAEIASLAMKSGKHVLCEKPLALTSREAAAMMALARRQERLLKCGFNIRYHPSIAGIKRLIQDGTIGEPYYVKATFGIGARPGYEKEWRVDPKFSSGGQLMEQGIHLIDLARWFIGEITDVYAMTGNYFVTAKPFEDNAFVTLKTEQGRVASMHASLTQWRNKFEVEVTGSDGYAVSSGMGGSYGVETLVRGRNLPGKPFSHSVTEFRGEDKCWDHEWNDFRSHTGDPSYYDFGFDGVRALQVIEGAYDSAKSGCTVKLGAIK